MSWSCEKKECAAHRRAMRSARLGPGCPPRRLSAWLEPAHPHSMHNSTQRRPAPPGGYAKSASAARPRVVPPWQGPWQRQAAMPHAMMAPPAPPPPPWSWWWQQGNAWPKAPVLTPVDEQVLDLIVKHDPADGEARLRLATLLLQLGISNGIPLTDWDRHPMYRYSWWQGWYAAVRGDHSPPEWLSELQAIIVQRLAVCTNHQ